MDCTVDDNLLYNKFTLVIEETSRHCDIYKTRNIKKGFRMWYSKDVLNKHKLIIEEANKAREDGDEEKYERLIKNGKKYLTKEKRKNFNKEMYKTAKENNTFKLIKGMIRRGTLRCNDLTMRGYNKKPEVEEDVQQTLKKWRDF